MRRTQEKFLEAMQERAPRAKFARLEPDKAQFNGQLKLYEKMTERGDKLCGTVKTTSKHLLKLSLKTKKNN